MSVANLFVQALIQAVVRHDNWTRGGFLKTWKRAEMWNFKNMAYKFLDFLDPSSL